MNFPKQEEVTLEEWYERHGVPCLGGCGEKVHPCDRPQVCMPCRARAATRKAAEERLGGIPQVFRWATLESAALRERAPMAAIVRARESVDVPRLVLVGPAGAGKTSLLCAMLRARSDAGCRVLFAPAWRLGLARVKHPLGAGEPDEVRQALAVDVCGLDDMGSERQTQTNAVPDVVFERHVEGRALWVTTAMSQDEMAQRYGDGITRRVFEHARVIDCGANT
jgi:DNA replication protein DnaC